MLGIPRSILNYIHRCVQRLFPGESFPPLKGSTQGPEPPLPFNPRLPSNGQITPEEATGQIERIIASPTFANEVVFQRFLRYIGHHSLQSQDPDHPDLKQRMVAMNVFQCAASEFSGKENPIVRKKAKKLRDMLLEYYLLYGSNDSIIIVVPKGGYRAIFIRKRRTGGNGDHRSDPNGGGGPNSPDIDESPSDLMNVSLAEMIYA